MGRNTPKEPPSVIPMPPAFSRHPPKVLSTAKPQPDRNRRIKPKKPVRIIVNDAIKRANAGPMAAKLARALSVIHPEAEGSEIRFTKDEVFLDSKKIGDIRIDQDMVKVRIWLQYLGYISGSIGPDELGGVFEINRQQFSDLMKQSNYLVLMGLQQGALSHIGLCFYKDFETRVAPSFPLRG